MTPIQCQVCGGHDHSALTCMYRPAQFNIHEEFNANIKALKAENESLKKVLEVCRDAIFKNSLVGFRRIDAELLKLIDKTLKKEQGE